MSAGLHRFIPAVLVAIGLAGFGLGAYLTVAHYGDTPLVCGGVGACGYVQSSDYAFVGGVPVAALGAALYLVMAAVALAWARFARVEWLPIAYWGLALAGAGYAAYLTYVELLVLNAICVWCVASAALLGLSLLLATFAVLREPDAEDEEGSGPVRGAALSRRRGAGPTVG